MAETDSETTENTPSTTLEDIQDVWDSFPWKEFPGYVRSVRAASTSSWVWSHGFDIQHSDDDSKRRWVCRPCIDKKRRRPHNTVATGTQNAENHLFFEHNIWDPTGKRRAPVKVKEKTPSKSITSFFNLNPNNPREQQIASTLIGGFSREKFQQLLVAWVIDSQASFRQIENQRFRDLLEYLNPLVSITDAHICHPETLNKYDICSRH